jgi:hypothetical protein
MHSLSYGKAWEGILVAIFSSEWSRLLLLRKAVSALSISLRARRMVRWSRVFWVVRRDNLRAPHRGHWPCVSPAQLSRPVFVFPSRELLRAHKLFECDGSEFRSKVGKLATCIFLSHHRIIVLVWPSLWYSGQSSWLQIQRSRVRVQALPDFLRSSGSGTLFTQPRESNWGATWKKRVAAPV